MTDENKQAGPRNVYDLAEYKRNKEMIEDWYVVIDAKQVIWGMFKLESHANYYREYLENEEQKVCIVDKWKLQTKQK